MNLRLFIHHASAVPSISRCSRLLIHCRVQRQNYYETLGIDSTASDCAIKAAFFTLSKKFHPDSCSALDTDKKLLHKKFADISEAYNVLKSSDRRKQYDACLIVQNCAHTDRNRPSVHRTTRPYHGSTYRTTTNWDDRSYWNDSAFWQNNYWSYEAHYYYGFPGLNRQSNAVVAAFVFTAFWSIFFFYWVQYKLAVKHKRRRDERLADPNLVSFSLDLDQP